MKLRVRSKSLFFLFSFLFLFDQVVSSDAKYKNIGNAGQGCWLNTYQSFITQRSLNSLQNVRNKYMLVQFHIFGYVMVSHSGIVSDFDFFARLNFKNASFSIFCLLRFFLEVMLIFSLQIYYAFLYSCL